MIPVQSYLPWKVSMTLLHVTAVSATCLRFEYRRRTRRLWWDDYAAIVPAVVECLNVSVLWLRLQHRTPMDDAQSLKASFSYLSSFCFASIIWWSRISLALAIVRITPIWSNARKITLALTFGFIINWFGLLCALILTCATHTSWQQVNSDILICGPAYGVALGSVITDVIGDILLVGLPLYRLWHIKLPKDQRRLVLLVFSTSLLTLVAAVTFCIVSYGKFLSGPGALLVWLMTSHIEEAISLIACNLLVLISWGYKKFSRTNDNDMEAGEQHITPHWSAAVSRGNFVPTFVLSNLSASHRAHSDGVISPSEISLPGKTQEQGEKDSGNGQKPVMGRVETISRKQSYIAAV